MNEDSSRCNKPSSVFDIPLQFLRPEHTAAFICLIAAITQTCSNWLIPYGGEEVRSSEAEQSRASYWPALLYLTHGSPPSSLGFIPSFSFLSTSLIWLSQPLVKSSPNDGAVVETSLIKLCTQSDREALCIAAFN